MEKAMKTVLLQMLAEISDLRASVSALSGHIEKIDPTLRRIDAEAALKNEKQIVDPQYEPLRKQIEAL
jgi:hypothetical protein